MNIYTLLETSTQSDMDIAKVVFKKNMLTVKSRTFSRTKKNIEINLSQIKKINKIQYSGSTQFTFSYEGVQLTFFESGLGTYEFLEKNLKQCVFAKL